MAANVPMRGGCIPSTMGKSDEIYDASDVFSRVTVNGSMESIQFAVSTLMFLQSQPRTVVQA